MKLLHKLKSILKQPEAVIEERSSEETISELINRLIIRLIDDGKSIASPYVGEGFGSFNIYVHNLGEENAVIEICKFDSTGNWNIKVKPLFKSF